MPTAALETGLSMSHIWNRASKEWCYCSGGYAKYPFEIILEQDLEVKLLETPLDGDHVCRFEIDLTNVKYK